MSDRLDVRKTYKLFVKGAFPRSESGRSYEVTTAGGEFCANVAWASRKDLRDAVVAARAAQPGWWAQTAYHRGQVLYRWAEMATARADELVRAVHEAEGGSLDDARAQVHEALDRLVWFAGWTDKIASLSGGANPVAGPYFNFSVPTPTGVVVVFADEQSSLLGFVDAVVAPLVAGNTVVAVASERRPVPALLLGECAATSDVPGGVVNILSAPHGDLGAVAAEHEDVDGLDVSGTTDEQRAAWSALAAGTIKRVIASPHHDEATSLRRIRRFIETATVWHTIGQ
jgi:acyl-CoA reductase-like NAD-dependent aldehyde dehydrogenase